MGGYFGVASKEDCVFDLYFGTDYHSHLGTRRAGMVVYDEQSGFNRAIHNIENSPFRTKFEREVVEMAGQMGIGSISDFEPQPLIVRSQHGTYAITTVGKINNDVELSEEILQKSGGHFSEMSGGYLNATELVASLINQKGNIIEGIRNAQDKIDGSMGMMILTPKGIYCARDKLGRTPIVIGKKEEGYCACFEEFAFMNLGYEPYKQLGPGEIVFMDANKVQTLVQPGDKMRICTFLWVYYGYPASSYEGISVEQMRYNCGRALAIRDAQENPDLVVDTIAGVPDSGIAAAIGYSNQSNIPFRRPFIKYTPTWARSFTPTIQSKRDMIAKMKLIPVQELIKDRRMLLVDDSIVRGTQLREKTEFLYNSGAKEVAARPACPPIMFGCKYLNFSRSTSEMELIARRVIRDEEGEEVSHDILEEYINPDSERYKKMVEGIRKEMGFASLSYARLDDVLNSIGIDKDKLCTYCWTGKE